MHSAGDIVTDVCIIETMQAEGRCFTPCLNRATLSKAHESMCTERRHHISGDSSDKSATVPAAFNSLPSASADIRVV